MWSFLRAAALWLIALALPLQGMAAASLLLCEPAFRPAEAVLGQAPVADPAHRHHHAHEGHADPAAPDGESLPAVFTGDEGSPQQEDRPGDPDAALQHSCGVCAFCCLGAALPSVFPPFELPHVSPLRRAPSGVASASFLTGGPDRPPRTRSA